MAAKAWGHPFFLRFDWEMNGSWFPWGVGANRNSARDFTAMWVHVHNIFTGVGATNVTWVWCPNVDPAGTMAPLLPLYPGRSYVDWTCLDGFNGGDPWTSFTDLFSSTYGLITGTIAPAKPMIVGETASTGSGRNKARWITNMFSALLTTFPRIRGLLWFEVYPTGHGPRAWPIETSTSSEAAFTNGIRRHTFVTNAYTHLTKSPIPPP